MITALRVITFHLFLLHSFTGWLWIWLYRYLIQFKPDLITKEEFEFSIAVPLLLTYVFIFVGLAAFTICGAQIEEFKKSNED